MYQTKNNLKLQFQLKRRSFITTCYW